MARKSIFLATLCLPAMLGACASTQGKFPSLAIRDAERVTGTAMPVEAAPPPPPAPLAPETGQRIAAAVEKARKAHSSFSAGTASASRTIAAARGSGPPSDAWAAAQVALAGLQGLRSETVIAQADLDLMFAQERLAEPGRMTPTADALVAARAQVDAWVDAQNRTIASLASQLRS
ncbi:MAG: hypothetical protein KDE32_02525 [Novosphingobium sp.]|nr:hypothetical protein [Novosphingobium sp.]